METFDFLPICALDDIKFFGLHGGLSPNINCIRRDKLIKQKT